MSPYEFRNVLVPIDGSEGAEKALDCALSMCVALGARLTALAVEGMLPASAALLGEVDEVKREMDEYFRGVLARAEERARERGVEASSELVPGHAAEVIAAFHASAHGHDLIVIGYRGHFRGDYLLGPTARPRRPARRLPGDGGALMHANGQLSRGAVLLVLGGVAVLQAVLIGLGVLPMPGIEKNDRHDR